MKKLLGALLVGGVLGAQAPALADLWDDNDWNDNDIGLWESDNWATDDYGYYDQDFDWGVADGTFDSWYADADDDWNDVYEYGTDYGLYDDDGDDGWFDI